MGEILKTCKNKFDWLKMIFFIKEGIFHHLYKVSSDFKTFCQVTILYFTPDNMGYQHDYHLYVIFIIPYCEFD